MSITNIEFEISDTGIAYEYIRKLVEKICEDHEGKRNLHVKIKISNAYLDESSSEDNVS